MDTDWHVCRRSADLGGERGSQRQCGGRPWVSAPRQGYSDALDAECNSMLGTVMPVRVQAYLVPAQAV